MWCIIIFCSETKFLRFLLGLLVLLSLSAFLQLWFSLYFHNIRFHWHFSFLFPPVVPWNVLNFISDFFYEFFFISILNATICNMTKKEEKQALLLFYFFNYEMHDTPECMGFIVVAYVCNYSICTYKLTSINTVIFVDR